MSTTTTTSELFFALPFWANNNPFHVGEEEMQRKINGPSRAGVMNFAPKFLRPFMPQQHRDFFVAQPFLVAAARDADGHMWSTLLTDNNVGSNDFVTSPTSTSLQFAGRPVDEDALRDAFDHADNLDVGLLGIEFANKRRNRVNGRVTRHENVVVGKDSDTQHDYNLDFTVDMSFGNCPQYIRPRKWWTSQNKSRNEDDLDRRTCPPNKEKRMYASKLTDEQHELIRNAETIFIATGYRPEIGGEGNPIYGNDASHRGGPKGWVKVERMDDADILLLPDFKGNDMFNSIGNLAMDPRMGVTFPVFETGGMLQLSGTGKIDFDAERANKVYPGAQRLVEFKIERVHQVSDGSLPVRFSLLEDDTPRTIRVSRIVQESKDVKSFYLKPQTGQPLWDYAAGNHLPIELPVGDDRAVLRTYSLSGSPAKGQEEYRLSVKRETFGTASRFLHDHINVGDGIRVSPPAGDFRLKDTCGQNPIVLLSGGIGVTPMLSMLHQLVEIPKEECKRRRVYWVHGARNEQFHPFQDEVDQLIEQGGERMTKHISYSRPVEGYSDGLFHTKGRLTADLLGRIIDADDLTQAEYYMCGPTGMMTDIESGLQQLGVSENNIHYETF